MATSEWASVLPWSYSSLTAYETCPRRFYLTRVTKQVVEPQTEAIQHGNEVHQALEKYVGGKADLPEKYAPLQPIADKIRRTPGEKLLEYKFGLTKALQPTGFFSNDAWVRGVFDVAVLTDEQVVVLDYKTGKRRLDMEQLRLFAGVAFSLWPHVRKVKTGYIWLQAERIDAEEFTPEQKVEIFQDFAARVHRMEMSEKKDDWPARPSGLCRNWCPVGRNLCEHCGG